MPAAQVARKFRRLNASLSFMIYTSILLLSADTLKQIVSFLARTHAADMLNVH